MAGISAPVSTQEIAGIQSTLANIQKVIGARGGAYKRSIQKIETASAGNDIVTNPANQDQLYRQDLSAGLVIAGPTDAPLRNRLRRSQGEGQSHEFWRLKPN